MKTESGSFACKLRIGILIGLLTVNGLGCTFLKFNLSPIVSPLKEKIISGEGSNKILLIDIRGIINNKKKRALTGAELDTGMVDRIGEILKKAEEDEDIKGIVLRINSPGGTVTSSDIIYSQLRTFKKKRKIKIYAAFMDLATSGGYYIAMAADHISAHPTSITGSIGVIALKVNLQGLMEKVGVDWEVVKSADKKDFLSPFRPFTEKERQLFQENINGMHQRFVEIIAKNRPGLELQTVRKLADGRIFSAQQALDHKLTDQIGYLDDVLERVKKELKVSDFKVVSYYRSGEYKSGIFTSSIPPTINMINVDLFSLPLNNSPQFMYLWMP
ncbi:MAG: signal peptide peptidase SppA [Nitrospinota bacterium]|nr:signal peptide peptidase SppA [Nitrospinota bacterium]